MMQKGLIIFDLDETLIFKGANIEKIKTMLYNLSKNNILVLLSNSNKRTLTRNLIKFDLQGYFDSIYSRSMFFNRKPLPFKYKRILTKYKVSKSKVYCVGDKLLTDVMGANILGLKSVLIREKLTHLDKLFMSFIKPRFIIAQIYDLPYIID